MKRIASLACALTLAAPMAGAEIVGEPYRYTVDGAEFEGYVARNTNIPESRGTVLIVHDWDGLTEYERRRAEMLAALGYTAFAVDVYGADVDPQGVDDYRRLTGALYSDRETFRTRLRGATAAADDIPGATGNRVLTGYCFGGQAVLEGARAGLEMDGFVTFHAGLGVPGGQDYSAVTAPILLNHGSADPVSGLNDLAAEIEAMKAADVAHDAHIYGGARHSFSVFGSDDYDLAADRASWEAFTAFLDEHL